MSEPRQHVLGRRGTEQDDRRTSEDPGPWWAPCDERGSLVTEYGLLAVVAATIAGVLIQWATGGAVINLFNALVDRARELVGA